MRRGALTHRAAQTAGAYFLLPLIALAVALSAVAAGCASPSSTSASVPPPPSHLHFVIDGNYLAAKSNSDLRSSIVALDASNGHVVWRHALEGSSSADATIARYQPFEQDGLVYVTYRYDHATDPQSSVSYGVVEVLEATTGKALWRREVGTEISGEPVVDGASVYVTALVIQTQSGAQSGLLEALDTRTGAVRWQRPLDETPSMAASANGRIFLIANQPPAAGHLLALDASNGSVTWDYSSNVPLAGGSMQSDHSNAPLVVAGRVVVQAVERNADGTAKLNLLALDARSGSVAWQYQTGGLTAAPSLDQAGDTLCLTVDDAAGTVSTILRLAPSNGARRWSIANVQGSVSGCTASGDTFYLTQRSRDFKTGSVFALSSQNGRQLWQAPTAPPVIAAGPIAPAVVGDVVGVYLEGPPATSGPVMSTMAVLRASDGKLLWRHDFDGRPDQVLDFEGTVIVNPEQSDNMPVVAAYTSTTGAHLWTYELGHL